MVCIESQHIKTLVQTPKSTENRAKVVLALEHEDALSILYGA